MQEPWRTAWIIGASSGIGRQVAIDLAASGVTVVASARSTDPLDELAAAHDLIKPQQLDIADMASLEAAFEIVRTVHGIPDLVVVCAAVWHPMGATSFDAEKANQSLMVNVGGINNVLALIMPGMIEQRGGQIAIVSSVAGYRGLPKAAAYGPTKAALINLAESLHPDLARYNVRLQIINPGFVETPMTAKNDFPMPFIVSVEEASRRIIKGLKAGRFEIAFPWRFVALLKLMRALPYSLYFWYIRKFVLKSGKQ